MCKFIQTFYLEDYETEYKMLEDFMEYMKKEKFDLWLSWNVKFDYNYLYNRIPDFAEKISIIGKSRYGDGEVFYPAGISIVDYLTWFKKITLNRDKSYALDNVAQKHLGEEHYERPEFGKLSEEVKVCILKSPDVVTVPPEAVTYLDVSSTGAVSFALVAVTQP